MTERTAIEQSLERVSHATCTASARQGHHVTLYFNELRDAQAFYVCLIHDRKDLLTRIYGDAETAKGSDE